MKKVVVRVIWEHNQQDNTCLEEIPVGKVLEQLEHQVENIEDYSTAIQQPLDGDTITRKRHMDDDFYNYQYICGDPERCIHEGKIYGEKRVLNVSLKIPPIPLVLKLVIIF